MRKECPRCKETKPLNGDYFYRCKQSKFGYKCWCKSCVNKSNAEYDKKNPEQHVRRILKSRNRNSESKQRHVINQDNYRHRNPLKFGCKSENKVSEIFLSKYTKYGMRIAICISGFMRSYANSSHQLIEHICRHHDTDIFISTWEIAGISLIKYPSSIVDMNVTEGLLHTCYSPYLKRSNIFNLDRYKPQWQRPKYYHRRNEDGANIDRVERLFAMCFHIKNCNDLKNSYSTNYDVVIRCRGDMFFHHPIDFKEIKPNTVYTPTFMNYDGINDQFAYGDTASMNTYASWYDSLDFYDSIGADMTIPEWVLEKHFFITGLQRVEDPSIMYNLA